MADQPAPQGLPDSVRPHRGSQGEQRQMGGKPAQAVQGGRHKAAKLRGQQRKQEQPPVPGKGSVDHQHQLAQGNQAAAKIVSQLTAAAAGKGIAPHAAGGFHMGEQPGQQLPVAPCPAVEALQPARQGGGVAVVEGDGRVLGAAGQLALQQVVAEHRIGENPVLRGFQQRVGAVEPLALKAAPPAQKLPQAAHARAVGIHPSRAALQQADAGAYGVAVHLHAGLQDAHAAHALGGAAALVQRMGQGAHQGQQRVGGGGGVAVQGQHIGIAPVEVSLGHGAFVECVLALAVDNQPVQRFQRAALAFPADVQAHVPVVIPAALQVEIPPAVAVHSLDGHPRSFDDLPVGGGGLGQAVAEISQQQAVHRPLGKGLAGQQQAAHHGHSVALFPQHGGDDNQRAGLLINAGQIHAGQRPGGHQAADDFLRNQVADAAEHPQEEGQHAQRVPRLQKGQPRCQSRGGQPQAVQHIRMGTQPYGQKPPPAA